jgi:hypothetical protein
VDAWFPSEYELNLEIPTGSNQSEAKVPFVPFPGRFRTKSRVDFWEKLYKGFDKAQNLSQ